MPSCSSSVTPARHRCRYADPVCLSQSELAGRVVAALALVAILHDRVKADLVATTGIWTGRDVAKMVLVGAKAVQVVSVLYREQPTHIQKMLAELSSWMDAHNFANLDAFRGMLGQKQGVDAWSFARGQYIKALVAWIRPSELKGRFSVRDWKCRHVWHTMHACSTR